MESVWNGDGKGMEKLVIKIWRNGMELEWSWNGNGMEHL